MGNGLGFVKEKQKKKITREMSPLKLFFIKTAKLSKVVIKPVVFVSGAVLNKTSFQNVRKLFFTAKNDYVHKIYGNLQYADQSTTDNIVINLQSLEDDKYLFEIINNLSDLITSRIPINSDNKDVFSIVTAENNLVITQDVFSNLKEKINEITNEKFLTNLENAIKDGKYSNLLNQQLKIGQEDSDTNFSFTNFQFSGGPGCEVNLYFGSRLVLFFNSMLIWQMGKVLQNTKNSLIPQGIFISSGVKIYVKENFFFNLGLFTKFLLGNKYNVYSKFLKTKCFFENRNLKHTARQHFSLGFLLGFGFNITKRLVIDINFAYENLFSFWEFIHFFCKLFNGYSKYGFRYQSGYDQRANFSGIHMTLSLQ